MLIKECPIQKFDYMIKKWVYEGERSNLLLYKSLNEEKEFR